MKKDHVSIITLNFNGKEVMGKFLSSLSSLSYPAWDLILVDNGSTDNSLALLSRYPKVLARTTIVKNNRNQGYAEGNNQGFRKSTGEYVLFLNNDTKIPGNLLTKLVKKIKEDTTVGIVQPKIRLMDEPGRLDNCGSFLTRTGFLEHWGFSEKDGPTYTQERLVFSAKGACMLVKREVIKKVGLFDKDFVSYFEESDFCWRVWLAGWKVLFWPQTTIYHKLAFTARRLNTFTVNYHSFKNRINSMIKNLSPFNLFHFMAIHLLILEFLAIFYILRLELKQAWIIQEAIFWNILVLPKTISKRRSVQSKMRKVSDSEIFQYVLRPFNLKVYFTYLNRLSKDYSTNSASKFSGR